MSVVNASLMEDEELQSCSSIRNLVVNMEGTKHLMDYMHYSYNNISFVIYCTTPQPCTIERAFNSSVR